MQIIIRTVLLLFKGNIDYNNSQINNQQDDDDQDLGSLK